MIRVEDFDKVAETELIWVIGVGGGAWAYTFGEGRAGINREECG